MTKPNFLATPILVNLLQASEHTFEMGVVTLTYDTDNFLLEVHLHEDNQLDISLWIGEDREITLRDEQKDAVYNYIHELYKTEIDAENEAERIQDHKDDLYFDNIKEDQFN